MAPPFVIGINDGYASTAAVLDQGAPAFNLGEERFNRVKNFGGVPVRALEWLEASAGRSLADARAIGVAWKSVPFRSIDAFRKARHKWFDRASRFLPSALVGSDALIRGALRLSESRRRGLGELGELLAARGVPAGRVHVIDHHRCHAAAALYGSGLLATGPEALAITLDGSGDGESMTVWRAGPRGMEKLQSRNSYHSLGILIARLTQYMGMKPLEHEYKLMGMAPYGEGSSHARRAHELFGRYFGLDASGLFMTNRMGAWGQGMVRRLHEDLFQVRFDGVCWAIQQLVEDLCVPLVLNWARRTGIRRVAAGGGLFMNIKLNGILSQHPELDEFFVLPSCGDESLALGAAYAAQEATEPGSSRPIGDLYLGAAVEPGSIPDALARHADRIEARRSDDVERETVRLLVEDRIVGRTRGRAEWGARALGNRSILCNPSRAQNVHRINKAVKKRDFWMPFCPSILDACADDYLVNPRGRPAWYMSTAFETRERARTDLACGLHPFDFTSRPQVVARDWNPLFHRLLELFREATGIGGVLNTSFNLHGLPIVQDAEDSIEVLLESEIDFVTIEDWIVWRKAPSPTAPGG